MYPYLHDLLSDKKGGATFSCFGVWHWIYIGINLVQLAKAEAPISSNVLGREISLSNTRPSNAFSPINFKLAGSVSE